MGDKEKVIIERWRKCFTKLKNGSERKGNVSQEIEFDREDEVSEPIQ